MKEYLVEVRVKNNFLLSRMRDAGLKNAAELSRASGVNQSTIGLLLSLKMPAVSKRGEWRQAVVKISEALRCLPEDVVPPQHVSEALSVNRTERTVSAGEIAGLLEDAARAPDQILEREQSRLLVEGCLAELSDRERIILERRFGFNGEPETLEEIAKDFDVGRGRINQIEAKALRRLKHAVREPRLREAYRTITEQYA